MSVCLCLRGFEWSSCTPLIGRLTIGRLSKEELRVRVLPVPQSTHQWKHGTEEKEEEEKEEKEELKGQTWGHFPGQTGGFL